MKKIITTFVLLLVLCSLVGCNKESSAIELMGAGDRIHDTYTFANTGVVLKDEGKNVFTVSGSVDKLDDVAVKEEFKIKDEVTHIVAIKLSANDNEVVKNEVEIYSNGNEVYDAEHLNGKDYTFILLEVVPGNTTMISVKWNKEMTPLNYIINFDENIVLK